MSWKHRVTVLMLAVLGALPLSGTVCAMACDLAAKTAMSAHHHGSAKSGDEPGRASTSPQIGNLSGHDCSTHDAAMRQVPTTAPERADLAAKTTPVVIGAIDTAFESARPFKSPFDYHAPPDSAPLTTTPLVLRV